MEHINLNSNPNISNSEQQKIKPQFDVYKDFEMRELLDDNTSSIDLNVQINSSNTKNEDNQMDMILKSFPVLNDNLRANILLSIEIYKKINNFDSKYIHEFINSKSIKK